MFGNVVEEGVPSAQLEEGKPFSSSQPNSQHRDSQSSVPAQHFIDAHAWRGALGQQVAEKGACGPKPPHYPTARINRAGGAVALKRCTARRTLGSREFWAIWEFHTQTKTMCNRHHASKPSPMDLPGHANPRPGDYRPAWSDSASSEREFYLTDFSPWDRASNER